MGIGALMGGLTAKQRGGNFLKGAIQGAALGGATGYLGGMSGAKAGTELGGMFGFGKKMLPNFLAMSGISMGSEMLGQSEANKISKLRQQAWLDEEEERRIARLSRIAGYDVADSANFMTPQSYFSARGGYKTRPQYQFGGISSLEDDPAEAVNIQELQMDPGTMSPGGLTEEFDYMETASAPSIGDEAFQVYKSYLLNNNLTEQQLPFETFIEMWRESAAAGQGEQQGAMMAAHGGSVMGKDEYDEELTRPGYAPGGITDLDLRGGGASMGPGTGTSDDIPAMLSDGEFVVTANAVKNLGGGDRMEGARRMYSMMNQLDPQSQAPAEMSGVGYA